MPRLSRSISPDVAWHSAAPTMVSLCSLGAGLHLLADRRKGLLRNLYPQQPISSYSDSAASSGVFKGISTAFRLIFLVVDPVLLTGTVDLAYGRASGPATRDSTSARAYVLAFMCIMSIFQNEIVPPFPNKIDEYPSEVQNLLGHALGDASLTGLQTVLMLEIVSDFIWSYSLMPHGLHARWTKLQESKPLGTAPGRQDRQQRLFF
ncbi:hypothetical protein V1508DRAFT_464445 [Lipomyces doorenjongii]|uniref:uncharacterized protein n=1 Tax=Lipomyces doorenjongii TaxID=383834 RepID=UPI0034CD1D46